jgi:hypothetical protein
VPDLEGSEYGKTPIRDLLHMSSGVEFSETRDGQRDLNRLWIDMVLGLGTAKGTINSILQFDQRIATPRTKFFYASIEPDVGGLVVHYAVNQSRVPPVTMAFLPLRWRSKLRSFRLVGRHYSELPFGERLARLGRPDA